MSALAKLRLWVGELYNSGKLKLLNSGGPDFGVSFWGGEGFRVWGFEVGVYFPGLGLSIYNKPWKQILNLGVDLFPTNPKGVCLNPQHPKGRDRRHRTSQFENNYFTEMCSGSEAGSYLRLIDFVYHSTLVLRVTKKKRRIADRRSLLCRRRLDTNRLLCLFPRRTFRRCALLRCC